MSDVDEDEPRGDPACLLQQVCPECGALVSPAHGSACWRCGSTPEDDDLLQ